ESVLADVLAKYGNTPLIAQTASKGGYHCYYGNNTGAWRHYKVSRRAIRPETDKPIDYLGCGFAVVPPSATASGRYEFIQGNLDDISRLPPFGGVVPAPSTNNIKEIAEAPATCALQGMREHEGRNNALFMAIGPQARSIHKASGSRDEVLAIA